MAYEPKIYTKEEYFLYPDNNDCYDYKSDEEDTFLDPYTLPAEIKSEVPLWKPTSRVRLDCNYKGKIKIQYAINGKPFFRTYNSEYKNHPFKLERELIIIGHQPEEKILDCLTKIFNEIMERRINKLPPNPDLNIIMHSREGMYKSIVVF